MIGMDVTPTRRMFEAMEKITDAMAGEAPLDVEKSPGAEQRRANRQFAMDLLHRLVHLSMREGAARAMNMRYGNGNH
jgi:hypothetical protein